MKLRVGIKCSGWERCEYVEIELPDSTPNDEAEEAMREAAIDAAGFEFWLDRRLDVPNTI
jgi:hypothetical protein